MINLAVSIWYLFMVFGGTTITNFPTNGQGECELLQRQMKAKLKPQKAECVEVPVYKPVQ